ncbi:universal stress protein [Thiohalomonas denitrificans]|uniref:universal stress protein n=1 Tax=Thiohalomonas denitrificans TaxID=415747 RepID=UPI0026EDA896|nr:universal stress protein [Thiohalomonas denitrificans]
MSQHRFLTRARSILARMGKGLEHAHYGELRPHHEKLEQLYGYRGESRVVVALDASPRREALEYAVDLARREGMLLDVLHVSASAGLELPPKGLIPALLAAGIDFRLTRREGELASVLLDYSRFRPDIFCIVSATRTEFVGRLQRQGIPQVVTVNDHLKA